MGTVVVTGAGSGIGKSVAIQLSTLKLFDNIALIGRSHESLCDTVSSMSVENVYVKTFEFDLINFERVESLLQEIFHYFGSIDCLINIAGFTEPAAALLTTTENFMKTYSINVFSPFFLMKGACKYMKRSGGKILNVASTAGITPRPGWVSYASSKAALISISQTLTEEFSEYGIKVYCVSPGRCATKLRMRLAPDEDPTTIMQPEEVAEIICQLVSKSENCLDGQNIVIRKKI